MNRYSEAIRLLKTMTSEMEHNLLYDIAAMNPGIIVKASKPIVAKPKKIDDSWKYKCAELIEKQLVLNAIKEYRALTGAGLVEAKRVIDAFRVSEYKNYLPY